MHGSIDSRNFAGSHFLNNCRYKKFELVSPYSSVSICTSHFREMTSSVKKIMIYSRPIKRSLPKDG
jgi:hypothetical protein